jgi:hypothetical protein
MFIFLFVCNKDEVYGYITKSTSVLVRVLLNDAGIRQRMVCDPDKNPGTSSGRDEKMSVITMPNVVILVFASLIVLPVVISQDLR